MLQKATSESVLAISILLASSRFTSPSALATHDRRTCASSGAGCAQVTDCPLIFACLKGMVTKQKKLEAYQPACIRRGSSKVLWDHCALEWGAPSHERWQTKGCCLCLIWHMSTRPLTQTRGAAAGLPLAGFGWKSQETSLHKHLGAFQPTGVLCASSLPLSLETKPDCRPEREMPALCTVEELMHTTGSVVQSSPMC